MRICLVAALGGAFALGMSVAASAEDSPTPESSASPTPSIPSRAKVFLVKPEQSDQDFMCDAGRVQSVLATAIAEHRPVSITLLDQNKSAVPDGVWTTAYGFRLTHKQSVIINVTMICGN